MKNGIILSVILIVLAGVLIVSLYNVGEPEGNNIYGVWEGEMNGNEFVFIFRTDGTCSLSFKDITTGEMNELNGTFELDFTKAPTTLSIRNIPQLNHPLYTVMELTDDDSLLIADFSPVWRLRPVSLDETSLTLRRIEGD